MRAMTVVLLVAVGCGSAVEPAPVLDDEAAVPDAAPACVTESEMAGIGLCREYATDDGPVLVCCFAAPTPSDHPTNVVTWGDGGICTNSAAAAATCAAPAT